MNPAHWKLEQAGKPFEPGERVGIVTVIAMARSLGAGLRVRVRCDCGHERVVEARTIRRNPPKTHYKCQPGALDTPSLLTVGNTVVQCPE